MDNKTEAERKIRNEYQQLWSNPEHINRNDQNQCLGWHFGFYEQGISTQKDAILNMNNYVDKLLDIKNHYQRILDAGCGVGATVIHIAKNHPELTIYGISLSPNEIDLAHATKQKEDQKNTEFLIKSYNKTDFPDGYFDGIYALETACYAKDPQIFLREMSRILNKHSKLIIIDIFRKNNLNSPFFTMFRKRFLHEPDYNQPKDTLDSFKKNLLNAGFNQIKTVDLIESKNVKSHHIQFYLTYYLIKTIIKNNKQMYLQNNLSILHYLIRIINRLFGRLILLYCGKCSYFSIVSVKE